MRSISVALLAVLLVAACAARVPVAAPADAAGAVTVYKSPT